MRPDYRRPNGAAIAAAIAVAILILVLACCWLLLLTGVLTWR